MILSHGLRDTRPLAVEVRALSGPAGGVVRYIRGLLRGLAALEPTLPLVLLCDRARGLRALRGFQGIPVPPAGAPFRLWWDMVALPGAVRRLRPQLLHLTKPSGTIFRHGLPPIVTTVYDVIPLEHRETQTLVQRTYWRMQLPLAVRTAAHILTISDFSKRRIVERLGVSPERITVTHPGIDRAFSPPPVAAVENLRRRRALDQPYVLCVGTIEPRKNVDVLLKAFARMAADIPHMLVIAGRWGWKTHKVEKAARDPRLQGRVRFLGPVPEADLPVLFGGAAVAVCLSRAEGFGFPPLEAMACGCPVVASTEGSFPETVGEAGVLVSPDDEDGVRAALRRVLEDQGLCRRLREKGFERAARFTWERTAAATVGVYRRVLARDF